MKLTKKIRCKDEYTEAEIIINLKTKDLLRSESIEKLDRIVDSIILGINDRYYFKDIKY